MRLYRNLALGALLALALPLQGANAVTECNVHIQRIFSGDEGMIWFIYTNGGVSWLAASDPDREATLSLAMTALIAGREVIVRYQADGIACNSAAGSLAGLWLL